MQTHQFFGLQSPPFDGTADPRFYFPSTTHAETLATLQYAVHSGKPCTLVLGESGSGKSLLARLLMARWSPHRGVLWVSGLGQPTGQTQASLCVAPGNAALGRHTVTEIALADWVRRPNLVPASLIIIDNADGLRAAGWQDVLALVTRETRAGTPVSVVLLGLPELLDTLANPALVRLQRRIFRTCRLGHLSPAEVTAYVQHRLAAAGRRDAQLFTPAALEVIARFADGNPALVNQLCDNALVDAFSEDRLSIDEPHVLATVQAISGGVRRRRYLPSPPGANPAADRMRGAHPQPDALDDEAMPGRWVTVEPLASDSVDTLDDDELPTHARPPEAQVDKDSGAPIDERLRALESRLADALTRVREARQRPRLLPPLPGGRIGAPLPAVRAPAATDMPASPAVD
jgi:type II secretory pathway predicted ATPase ExeA